jgi:hypothetical protein
MKAIMVNKGGWEVVTAAWTAAAKPGRVVEIAYVWGADGISFFQSATGVERVTLNIDMQSFLSVMHQGTAIIDLREYQ